MQRTKRRLTHSGHEPADSQPGKELGKEDINHLSAKYTAISYEHSNVRGLKTQQHKNLSWWHNDTHSGLEQWPFEEVTFVTHANNRRLLFQCLAFTHNAPWFVCQVRGLFV